MLLKEDTMSATNRTTYYGLPIFIGSDTPSWLGDWNNTMNSIDGAMNSIKGSADNALSVANTAENKSDGNTETINALTNEVNTIKQAVKNYDQILDFELKNLAIATNNLQENFGGAMMSQNTNKTLSKIFLYAKFNKEIDQLISYNYTDSTGTKTWIDLFTVEDNCFNLTQGSQPSANNALTIGGLTWSRNTSVVTGNFAVIPRFLRAWYDGATTHFGSDFNADDLAGSLKNIVNTYIYGNFTVFLSGSVYNPTVPGAGD